MDPWFAKTRVPEAIMHSPRETPGTGPVFTLQLLFLSSHIPSFVKCSFFFYSFIILSFISLDHV